VPLLGVKMVEIVDDEKDREGVSVGVRGKRMLVIGGAELLRSP